jgi:peptidoglycan/LPS O-acetylase OafA/YrhL
MSGNRIEVLDGWRGISILMVLGAHLLPLGPKAWQLNHVAGVFGMVIFFILSGFLITQQLASGMPVRAFLIRRFFRIVPLAFVCVLLLWALGRMSGEELWRHLTFTANLPPPRLSDHTAHFWSLCVEVQFYVFVAWLVAVGGRKSLWLLVGLAVLSTLHRVQANAYVDINTLRRIDEILAGAALALLMQDSRLDAFRRRVFGTVPWWLVVPLVLMASHPQGQALNFLRPYLALWMIGSSLVQGPGAVRFLMRNRFVIFCATISYALYVIHGVLMDTWLGTGLTTLERYLKRPLLFAVAFAMAYGSTRWFEAWFIEQGRKLAMPSKTTDTGVRS